MFEQHRAARLKKVFVHNAKHGNIVLKTALRSNNCMLVIDDLFQIGNLERHATDLVNLKSFFFLLLVLRFESFLVLNEFLLH